MTGAQRLRRSPTSEELRTWRDFIETVQALSLRLDGRLQSESSLSQGDYRVLLALIAHVIADARQRFALFVTDGGVGMEAFGQRHLPRSDGQVYLQSKRSDGRH